ncbi:MAG: hypothetical protein KGN39_13080 [Betaproteobacteria bacterium]|nr:hypothetical protein [Betaproteobacteria bacterium]
MNQEPCTVADLAHMSFDDTVHPRAFFDRALEVAVDDWADLDKQLVAWLAREGHLTKGKLPIHNHAGRGKYFINDKPQHSRPDFGGDWHKVGDFYVDTKYNAQSHIKNLLATLEQLSLRDPHFYLAFRTDAGGH